MDEVAVRWEDRAGTKVNLLLDALRSFGDLLRIRLYSATGAYRRPSAPSEFGLVWRTRQEVGARAGVEVPSKR